MSHDAILVQVAQSFLQGGAQNGRRGYTKKKISSLFLCVPGIAWWGSAVEAASALTKRPCTGLGSGSSGSVFERPQAQWGPASLKKAMQPGCEHRYFRRTLIRRTVVRAGVVGWWRVCVLEGLAAAWLEIVSSWSVVI